jgi:hypothetical protein
LAILALQTTAASAAEVAVSLQVGASLPFYSQTFSVDPNTVLPASVPLHASGSFSLDASGGLSLAGGVTWYFAKAVGIEARVDSAAISLDLTGGDITASESIVDLSAHVSGEAHVDRLTAFSLDLHWQTPGKVRAFLSGGISYLPAIQTSATARIQGQLKLPFLPDVPLPAVGVSANGTLDSAVGGNVGGGVEIPIAPRAAFVVEGRAFAFPTRQLQWGSASGGVSPIEVALAGALDPIKLKPGFFQLTGGVTLRW